MLKPFQRGLAALLCLLLVFALLPARAQALSGPGSAEEVRLRLAETLEAYPDGASWEESFNGAIQCFGFAQLVVYRVFGESMITGKTFRAWDYSGYSDSGMLLMGQSDYYTEEAFRTLLADARPGDVLQFDAGPSGHQHSMVIYAVDEDGVTLYECNWTAYCQVSLRELSYAQLAYRQKANDGTLRGRISLLRSDNYPRRMVYAVSYDANGGSGAPAAQSKTEGVDLVLRSETPARPGFAFLGWHTDPAAAEPLYQPGDTYTADANLQLFAVWQSEELKGDLNTDGEVNGIDGVLMAQFLAGWTTELSEQAADVDDDGRVSGRDAVILYQYLAGWEIDLG